MKCLPSDKNIELKGVSTFLTVTVDLKKKTLLCIIKGMDKLKIRIHRGRLTEDISKDTAGMFLLYWCLSGVNGFTDAAELMETEKRSNN